MLATLIRFSIRYYGIVIALACMLLAYGGYRFANAGLDIFPEFAPKQITIQTEAPGFSAEQVEILVTQPTETAISGLIGLKSVRSESIQGLSVVTAIFAEETDAYRNRQLLSERLAGLTNQLPPGIINAPVAVPMSSSSSTVLTIGLNSKTQDLMYLRSLVDWTIIPRILAVPGVADVNVFGGQVQQLQIQIDPNRLHRFRVSMDEVTQAATETAKIHGGGFVENENQRFTVQITGQTDVLEQFNNTVVKQIQGRNILISDVATVQFGPEPPIGAAQIMGNPAIVMMVIGQFGANTLEVSRRVEQTLQEFAPVFSQQGIDFYPHLFRPADYIETSLANLSGHLLLGGLFVLAILYAFLFNFRSAFIAAVAIPLSLISAILVLLETGTNLNIMVLGGLAIALGEVVDDAIIDTENIFRRLRENNVSPAPKSIALVVFQASMEVRRSVVYASFIVALAFVPLLTLTGVAGRLFAPLGYSYILAILMSLLIALTLTPALCFLLLGKNLPKDNEPPLVRKLIPGYIVLLNGVSQHFNKIGIICITLCLAGVLAFFNMTSKFLPELREGHYIVHTSSIPGTSLLESIRTGTRLTELIMNIPGVDSVSQWAGRAERGADTYGSHYSEYEVRLKPMQGAEQQRVLNRLRETLTQFPGILYEANTFLTERVDETISGYTSPVVVNVFGNDLNLLDEKAEAIAAIMRTLPGAADVQLRSPPGTPLLQVRLDQDRMNHWGLRPAQVMTAIKTAYESQVIGKNYQGNRIYDIAVSLTPEFKSHPEMIGELPIRTPAGNLITLAQVADIEHTSSRYNILHQGAQRKQTVTCNIVDQDFDTFIADLKQRVAQNIQFPLNVYPEFTGAAIEQAQARKDLILHSLLAGAGVLIFIYLAIGSFRHLLLTLVNLPFSILGGVAAVFVTGATLSVGSIVGFVTLFGITVRNSIMLLSHYQHLIDVDGKEWNLETATQGAQERLPSILMTALVTALAMFPIAFNSDNPGREIMGPMAAIIIGGLASSTLLNLLLLPAMLLRFGKFERK